MHIEILNDKQRELLPMISTFRREFYLVGGTAIALYLGYRRSVDFDLFKRKGINHIKNIGKIEKFGFPILITRRVEEQMNLIVNDVKLTFFEYPFEILATTRFDKYARMPALLDLAAMKAFALGRRSKWKDYVDLYFITKEHYSLDIVIKRAVEIYGELFSDKLFRSRLSFYDDVDYSESVEYLIDNPPSEKEIKDTLTYISTQIL